MRRARAAISMAAFLWAAPGCGTHEPPERIPTPVRTHEVAPAGSEAEVRYSANIEPRSEATLSFRVGGYVEEVLTRAGADGRRRPVQEGDVVDRGTVLARIREIDYKEKVRMARGQLAEAEALLDRARAEMGRADRLLESRSMTRQDHDAVRASYEGSRARADAAAGQVEEAELALRDCALTAPFTGVILSRRIDVGELAAPGAAAFVVADLASVKAVFGVPESILKGLKPGDTLPIQTLSQASAGHTGRITSISPSADQYSRVFDVEVTIPNPDGRLKPGMIATVPVPGDAAAREGDGAPPASSTASSPMAPLGAIVRSPAHPDGYAVFVVETGASGAVARAREVTLGEVRGNLIQVLSGLTAGERVVVGGASFLVDGEPVAVIP